MAIELICEVLNHAPQDLSSAERLVLVVIAESADRRSRKCWPSRDLIAHRAGLELSGLKKVFQRLAARGIEVRMPIGKDKSGRLVFAHEGHRSEYILPRFDFHSPDERGDDQAPTEREGGQAGPSGGTAVPKRGDARHPQTVIEPSKEPSSSRVDRAIATCRRITGSDEDDAKQIIQKIQTDKQPDLIDAYVANWQPEDFARYANNKPVSTKPTWCGRCDERTRLKWDEAKGSAVRCGTCHPLSPDRQRRPNEPYRNPEDQSSYDDWGQPTRGDQA